VVDDALNETPNLPALPDDPGQFILYQTEDGRTRIEVRFFGETVWLSQKTMAELFQKDVRTINEHIRNVFSEGELHEPAVIRKFRITASDGKQYDTLRYNLDHAAEEGKCHKQGQENRLGRRAQWLPWTNPITFCMLSALVIRWN
jgi:hypothetical protein